MSSRGDPSASAALRREGEVVELRGRLAELHAGLAEVCAREQDDELGHAAEVAGAALGAVGNALLLLEEVSALYDGSAAQPSTFPPENDAESAVYSVIAQARANVMPCDVANVAGVAGMALRGRKTTLEALLAAPGVSRWDVVASAGGAIRSAQKALAAVDRAIATCHGGAPSQLRSDELAASLAVRRAYVRFARGLQALAAPTPDTILVRLRTGGNMIAVLAGSEDYAHMRTKDRALLRAMQERIRARLLDPAAPAAEGLRIWQDLESLAELLLGINKREELIGHDATALSAAMAELDAAWADGDALAPQAVCEALAAVGGRDPRLDTLLSRGAPPTMDALRDAASCALAMLAPPHASAAWEASQRLPAREDYF